MSGDAEIAEPTQEAAAAVPSYSVAYQKVELEIDFLSQRLIGKTEITIHPNSPDLKVIKLNLRQCKLTRLNINSHGPTSTHKDPYNDLTLHAQSSVHQYNLIAKKIELAVKSPPEEELSLNIPKKIRIEKVNQTTVHTQTSGTLQITNPDTVAADAIQSNQSLAEASVANYTPLIIKAEFTSKAIRDGLHFITHRPGNGRYPCVYTRNTTGPGSASCLFPCVDTLNTRCPWDITIKCPRTVGDILGHDLPVGELEHLGLADNTAIPSKSPHYDREMLVLCSGEMTDEILDKSDPSKKSVSFTCSTALSAQQIGFAVGPFEHVNLSEFRSAQEEEELGQNAVEIHGYCLSGRTNDLKNTCLPTARAMDFIVRKYGACPFKTYTMCFIDDLPSDTSISACFCLCSNRLLYPENIIDPGEEVTRALVHAIAYQWVGVDIVPREPADTWVTVGIAHYITEAFMKDLCGNNEYRYRMKQQADLVCELDRDRPSLLAMGAMLHVDPSEREFIAMKAPLVLFILDRRIAKVMGSPKMPAIISKILSRARLGELEKGELSTEFFQKTCERFYHAKIDDFLSQWVRGAGCPRFQAFQRFNKKKLVVEMLIQQIQGKAPDSTQGDSLQERDLEVATFMRDVKEEFHNVYAAPVQNVFTGPMTIRIHEADGTPYEHIVEIKDAKTTFDIPYNTKYKRLKRSKRQREKSAAAAAADPSEAENDALVYCLGDVLQTDEEIVEWKLTDWSPDEEERMSSESYEWIRLDADFEWICRIQLQMPGYMFVSQLQQDRDIVAQLESIHHMNNYPAHPLVSSILIRTMMDRRYFHGIRTLAARSLAKHATEPLGYIGLYHLKKAFEEMFCLPELNSRMTRPNDFSNRSSYYLQCEIVAAVSRVRDAKGFAPREVKEFLLDKLKFNDNSVNEFSDFYYVAKLMRSVSEAIAAKSRSGRETDMIDADEEEELRLQLRLEQDCLAEIDRHRRMDEWTSSYQNLYSRTALDCQLILSKAGVGSANAIHFLQYTRPENFDMLRQTAFNNLIECQIFETPSVLRYFLYCLASDPSPWIRENLRSSFGKALALKAIGDVPADLQPAQDGLIIEDHAAEETRKMDLFRKRTVEGALRALKNELGTNEGLKASLWSAVNSPYVGLNELRSLLDFCEMLYDVIYEAKVVLRYPRYWKVQNVGKGVLKFSQTNKVRTKPVPKYHPPTKSTLNSGTVAEKELPTPPLRKLTFKNPKAAAAAPAAPAIPAPTPKPAPERKQTLKIKFRTSQLSSDLKRDDMTPG